MQTKFVQAILDTFFHPVHPNLDSTLQYVTRYQPKTIDRWSGNIKGTLNGKVDTGWMDWDWKIPANIALGDYRIQMSVWNTLPTDSQEHKSIGAVIHIIDPDDSHNPQRFLPSVSDS